MDSQKKEILDIAEKEGRKLGGRYFGASSAGLIGLGAGISSATLFRPKDTKAALLSGLGGAAVGAGIGYLEGRHLVDTEAREELEEALESSETHSRDS